MYLNHNSQSLSWTTTVRVENNMMAILIQTTTVGMVNRSSRQNVAGYSFANESCNNVIIDQLALNLVDICLDNMQQISCKSFLYIAKIGKID